MLSELIIFYLLLRKCFFFKKKRGKKTYRVGKIFDISDILVVYYEYTTESCCKHMEGGVNIYLYVDVYRSICLCVWCVFVWLCVRVCVRVRMYDGKPSINSAPCCIDHTVRYFWYKVTEAGQGYVHNYQGNVLLSKLTGQPKSQGKQEGNQ